MEKIRVNYTDNTKEGMKKKRRDRILKKLKPMRESMVFKCSILSDNLEDLRCEEDDVQFELDDVECALDHMSIVYQKISNGESVSREDLKECEYLYEEHI